MTAILANILPPARTTFSNANGVPLAGGQIYFYIPNSSTFKNTWQDAGEVNLNTNPVVLDGAGSALIYGVGQYRQVVYDNLGNLIWDGITANAASGTGQIFGTNSYVITPTLSPALPSSGLVASLPAGTAILGGVYMQFPAVNNQAFTANTLTNYWLNADGSWTIDSASNTNYTVLSHYPNSLHIWQISAGTSNITAITLCPNTYPTTNQPLDISGSIDGFAETFYLYTVTTNWSAGLAVIYGQLLLNTNGDVYQVLLPGTTGSTMPTFRTPGSQVDGTAQLLYYCNNSYLGMFRKAANNGIEYYFINQGLEMVAHKKLLTGSPLGNPAGTTMPSLVKSHIQGCFKHLVGNRVNSGTYLYGQKMIAGGYIWLNTTYAGGTVAGSSPFSGSYTVGSSTVTDGGVTWLCIYKSYGSQTWFWMDTDATFWNYIYPDSHDSYASTFASLLCRYIECTSDYSWMTGASPQPSGSGTYYTYQQIFKNIIYQNMDIQLSNFLTKTFQYNIAPWDGSAFPNQYLEDNCESVKGYRAAAYVYGVLGDTTSQTAALSNVNYVSTGVINLYNTTYNFFATEFGQNVATWATNPNIGWYPYLQAQFFPELCNVGTITDDVLKLIRYNVSSKWSNYWQDKAIDIFPNAFIGYLAAKSWQDSKKAEAMIDKMERYYMNGGSVAQGYQTLAGAMTIAEYGWYLAIKDALIAPLTILGINGNGKLMLQNQTGDVVLY